MNRFAYNKKKIAFNNIWISVLIFLFIIVLFYYGLTALSQQTTAEQKASLENALQDSIVQCYCIEGFYPENLAYLEDNYGISYDKAQFFVDYQTLGSNIMPDITVIMKK